MHIYIVCCKRLRTQALSQFPLLYIQLKGASFPLPFDKVHYENMVNVHLLQRIHEPLKEETQGKASATEMGLLPGTGKDREESYLKTECIILFIDTDSVLLEKRGHGENNKAIWICHCS